jgi:flagellar protein FliS
MNAITASKATSAYATVSLESSVVGADPHQLIAMLYQGALLAIANAKNAILRKDVPAKVKAITHAIRIINEGLKASLDKNVGGDLALDLDALYDYMCLTLVNANLKNDINALDEVTRLLSEIKGAWDSIRKQNVMPMPAQPPAQMPQQSALVYGRR